jgi:hypothetical protein
MQKIYVWLPILLLAAAVCAAVGMHVAWQKSPPPPSPFPRQPTAVADAPGQGQMLPTDLAYDYRTHHISVRSIPVRDGDGADVYLFFEGGPPDPLSPLDAPQSPDYIDRWKNTVLARYHPDRRLDGPLLTAWRNCGLRMGPYLLFGDPVWIARSREMMLQDGHGG